MVTLRPHRSSGCIIAAKSLEIALGSSAATGRSPLLSVFLTLPTQVLDSVLEATGLAQ
tara:strand:+ start:1408 stop:1581 length:174 start_codon:yes stop_codon:yes gene_type:complete